MRWALKSGDLFILGTRFRHEPLVIVYSSCQCGAGIYPEVTYRGHSPEVQLLETLRLIKFLHGPASRAGCWSQKCTCRPNAPSASSPPPARTACRVHPRRGPAPARPIRTRRRREPARQVCHSGCGEWRGRNTRGSPLRGLATEPASGGRRGGGRLRMAVLPGRLGRSGVGSGEDDAPHSLLVRRHTDVSEGCAYAPGKSGC